MNLALQVVAHLVLQVVVCLSHLMTLVEAVGWTRGVQPNGLGVGGGAGPEADDHQQANSRPPVQCGC